MMEEGNHTRKTILIAEDNDSNYMLMSYILRKRYNIVRACDGQAAVDMACEGGIDLVLMDLKMPLVDGLEATRIIRSRHNDVPIVMLTANAFENDRQAAFDAGCNDFLSKPINSAICLETVAKYI